MGKIVILGEVVADVYLEDMPSEVEMPLTARPGAAPANVAVAAAKLGAEASFVGRLGDDLFGDFILRALETVGVDTPWSCASRRPRARRWRSSRLRKTAKESSPSTARSRRRTSSSLPVT